MKNHQAQMVKGQVHKVTLNLSTKTSNICGKRHPIVKIYQSYRKSRSPDQMMRLDFFDRKLLIVVSPQAQ